MAKPTDDDQQAEDLATFLKNKKYNAGFFHAGMKPEDKTAVQDAFMSSKVPIVSIQPSAAAKHRR